MIYSDWKAATIAISTTSSAAVDLGKPYETLIVSIPTITTGTLKVQGSETSGGTYQDLYCTDPADGHENALITTSGTGAYNWILPIGGYRFIKVVASASQAAERLVRVRGVRS